MSADTSRSRAYSSVPSTPIPLSPISAAFSPMPFNPLTSPSLAAAMEQEPELIPMENFALVCKGVYRSAFPKKKNFPFMKKLGLKSVLTLILEDYPEQNLKFLDDNGIKLFQFGVAGNKEPFVDIPEAVISDAITVILDRRNHPILIHCNKGKHRTGCLVACLRKILHWSLTSAFAEYRAFAAPKERAMDQQFVEVFDTTTVKYEREWVPEWPELGDG